MAKRISLPRLSRRGLLRLGGWGLAGILAGGAGLIGLCRWTRGTSGSAGSTQQEGALDRLAGALGGSSTVQSIGRGYLRAHPDEASRGALATELCAALPVDGMTCHARALDVLGTCSVADFRAGRTVQVDGWVLGRTEARACAWAELRRSGTA
jgi:hypothetical protein